MRRCRFDAVNVKLKPRLWCRNVVRPGIFAKTGLRRLRKRPQGETLCASKSFRMKIAVSLLFEGDAEGLPVELAAMVSSGQGSERLNAQLLVDSIPALIHTARPDG